MEPEIRNKYNADVLVAGGGTAGVFAAISSAKTGAKTILIEKNSILGGTMTVAGVNFPGLFYAWGKQIINGPCWESIERTIQLGGAQMPEICYKPERHWHEQIRLNRFVYSSILFEMCEESGVQIICNSMISDVKENTDDVTVIITEKTGLSSISAKKVIDATGDANLVQMAGYAVEKSKAQQPATLQNHISGYDMNNISETEIRESFENESFPEYLSADNLINYLRIHKLDVHIPCCNADTSAGKTQLEKNAFSYTMKIYKFLRNITGLENLEIDFVANETGVRESNRIVGESTITAEDYINGVLYPDSVCYAFYPIDLHVMNGIKKIFHGEGIVSKIPYSALIPKGSNHILCAGRCISSDTDSNSAIRVEAVCMATGQVSGCAAAIASKTNESVRKISYQKLCNTLESLKAIVPKI